MTTVVLTRDKGGAWDDEAICCPTVVENAGDVFMWYGGQSSADHTWRIGLARSTDHGQTFARVDGPVLVEGPIGRFDDRGVTEPYVIWDPSRKLYRMWYRGNSFLGTRSIGYAVSTNGIRWEKPPEGLPAVTAEQIGLSSIGNPSVLREERGLRMWVDGTRPGELERQIYELVNGGRSYVGE